VVNRFRIAVVVLYVGLVCAFFGLYYYFEQTADADTAIDGTPLLALVAVLSFPAGLLIARVWAIVLPLAAFPLATMFWLISSFDGVYAARYDDGALRGADWVATAYVLQWFAIPAMAFGMGIGFAVHNLRVIRSARLRTR
jgi:hypothetical protein